MFGLCQARLKNDQEPEEEEVLEAFAQEMSLAGGLQPPFAWKVASEFEREFEISGSEFDVVTKLGDFKDPHWVVPVGGTLRLLKEGMDDQLDQLEIGGHLPLESALGTHLCTSASDADRRTLDSSQLVFVSGEPPGHSSMACSSFIQATQLFHHQVMRSGRCSCIVFKESDPNRLAMKRPAKFVVSCGLNPAATKAFVDALRLSRPGPVPYLEPHSKETKVTTAIRHKYDHIFEGMKDAAAWPSGKLVKFGDRTVKLVFAPQGINEGVAQALVRYANNFEADFVMVGTNVLRVDRGKPPVGSVSLQIVMEFPGNCVVSSFNPDTDTWQHFGSHVHLMAIGLV
eukprot:g29757.t1